MNTRDFLVTLFCLFDILMLEHPASPREIQVDFAVKRREWEVLSAADFDQPGVNGPCEVVSPGEPREELDELGVRHRP